MSSPLSPGPRCSKAPISKGISDAYFIQTEHVGRTVWLGSSGSEIPWQEGQSHGPDTHVDQSVLICFIASPALRLATPSWMYSVGQKVRQEVHENGSAATQHGREGAMKGRREGEKQSEKGPVRILEACCLHVWSYDHHPRMARTTYLGHIYLNSKKEYTVIKKMASQLIYSESVLYQLSKN